VLVLAGTGKASLLLSEDLAQNWMKFQKFEKSTITTPKLNSAHLQDSENTGNVGKKRKTKIEYSL